MIYETFEPPPPLAPYVRFFWVLEADVANGEEFVHRSMADGCVEIVFHYFGTFDEIESDGTRIVSPLSNIQAQSTMFRRFSTNQSFGIFGAYLYPYAIPRLFNLPAYDLTNISPDLGSVFGREGSLLEEQMITAVDNTARVRIISDFLIDRLRIRQPDLPTIHHAIQTLLDAAGDIRIPTLAREHGLSLRQFQRKFKEFAGLSPKTYSRVARFQAATRHKFIGAHDLTEIAYTCGYYDQSHFINDFRQFSGYTPKEYFWADAEGTQYMSA
ncbi:MAG TPA: helix-turn-helix transcriptional regulator [Pyrinomonadaceae bacterium]|nr:helix-turn-helix transcriptional regulator [Pyrinomonadaceae bacterium]